MIQIIKLTMAESLKAHILLTITIFLSLTKSSSSSSHSHQPIKGAYYPWAQDFPPSSINTNLFTHLYYAFLNPNNITFKLHIDPTESLMLKNFTSTLQSKNPQIITLFSVGGYGEERTLVLSSMAAAASSRASFINSTIEVARKFGFHGIDLDWEYPRDPAEMEKLASLLEEWRVEVQKEAEYTGRPPLLLTAAVYYSAYISLSGAHRVYPSASITKNLDWINVMNYDYHGGWDKTATGAHAALFDPKSNVSTSYGIGSWIGVGVPRSKLIMGLPLYGRTWKLKDSRYHGVGAPAIDVGPGPEGVLTFAEVVKFNRDYKAKVVYDAETVSMYSVAGDYWVGYDDTTSVTVKIGYARALGLRGHFFWAVTGDYKWRISKRASQLWSI